MTDPLIDTFIEQWLGFDLQIRERRGLNEALYQELKGLLKQIKTNLEGCDAIPKQLAEIFVDMWGAMTCSADQYDSEMQARIYQAADHLADYARDICTSP